MSGTRESFDLLSRCSAPRELRRLEREQLDELAAEIRAFLIDNVSRTGGHLGPNLGVVELTIGLHRVFRSPQDTIIFDTGHQAYVHKLLTGRQDFSSLRCPGGLSGYPSRSESEHDVVESSHASASIAWVDGISREKHRQGDRTWTVGVIGDGALTGGLAWEALNNIATAKNRRIMIIINDNGRSYAPTIGGLAAHLDALRTSARYEKALAWGKQHLLSHGAPGRAAYDALHGLKSGIKDALMPQVMFEDLGLKYIGPVNGHDIAAVETALRRGRSLDEPVLVHMITEKGRGYTPAEEDIADRFHAVGPIHPETGLPVAPERFGWTGVFADEICSQAATRDDIVGITAAMMRPVGLGPMHEAYPGRVIDVGIAEAEAVASAAGMAYQGAHPVVALYATFLNRGFDQLLMDVALHRAGVTFVLDRAGVTGADGASHNGVWDIAMCSIIPGLRLAAPRDEETLRARLREALDVDDAPTVIRYRKGALPEPMPALRSVGGVDILFDEAVDGSSARVLIVGTGACAPDAIEAARRLSAGGVNVTVADPQWMIPVCPELATLARDYDCVVSVEDGIVQGGFGWSLRDAVAEAGVPVRCLGVPQRFPEHGDRSEMIAQFGFDAVGIERAARELVERVGKR